MTRRRSLQQEVQAGLRPTWAHPVTPARGLELLDWWLARHDRDSQLAAALLGVGLRTLQRWISSRRVPMTVAVLLDQVKDGPAVQMSISRRQYRQEWRSYLLTVFESLRQPLREESPTFGGLSFEALAAPEPERRRYWTQKRLASKRALRAISSTAEKVPAGSGA